MVKIPSTMLIEWEFTNVKNWPELEEDFCSPCQKDSIYKWQERRLLLPFRMMKSDKAFLSNMPNVKTSFHRIKQSDTFRQIKLLSKQPIMSPNNSFAKNKLLPKK